MSSNENTHGLLRQYVDQREFKLAAQHRGEDFGWGSIPKTFCVGDYSVALRSCMARGALVNEQDVADSCQSGRLWGYAADVLEHEPPLPPASPPPKLFQTLDNIIITPHIGSPMNESVQRQGVRAAKNLVNFLKGDKDYIQANRF